MNRNFSTRARKAFASTKAKAMSVGAAALTAAPFAFAGGGGFDAASITAKITENTGIAVGLVGAFILGAWTLRSMGLLGGKR